MRYVVNRRRAPVNIYNFYLLFPIACYGVGRDAVGGGFLSSITDRGGGRPCSAGRAPEKSNAESCGVSVSEFCAVVADSWHRFLDGLRFPTRRGNGPGGDASLAAIMPQM